MPEAKACLVCGGRRQRVVFREFGIDILRCRDCGHVFSSYGGDPDYAAYFGDAPVAPDGDQFWWDDAHRPMYDAFCARFLEGRSGRLLDVGAGLGFFVRRAQRVPGWEAHGCEMSAPAVAFAREKLGLATMRAGRLEAADFAPASFDVITLGDVIEHLVDPGPMLGAIRALLRPGGFLFLHTPNADVQLVKAWLKSARGMRPGVHYLEAKDHLHLYSMKTLGRVLERAGFARVRYVHLPPIQSVAGNKSALLRLAKNGWYRASATLFRLTFGTVNFDNLFAVASAG